MAASVTQKRWGSFDLQETVRAVFTDPDADGDPLPFRPQDGAVRTVVAVVAGGLSTRMGNDKSKLMLGDRPLGMWPARALSGLSATRVQLGGDPIPGLGWSLVDDLRPGCGPAGGIESGLATFPGAALVVCGVDLPFIPKALLAALSRRLSGARIAVAPHHADRWHPLCAAYSPAFLPPLREWLDCGRRDLQGLLDSVDAAPIGGTELEAFGDPGELLRNVNTPDDLEAARVYLDAEWAAES